MCYSEIRATSVNKNRLAVRRLGKRQWNEFAHLSCRVHRSPLPDSIRTSTPTENCMADFIIQLDGAPLHYLGSIRGIATMMDKLCICVGSTSASLATSFSRFDPLRFLFVGFCKGSCLHPNTSNDTGQPARPYQTSHY